MDKMDKIDKMDKSNISASASISHLLTSTVKPLDSIAPRQIVPPYAKFHVFQICYVQPNPLPAEVELLQKLRTEGLVFVKIPIDDKSERLYLKEQIHKLIKLTNVNGEHVDRLISDYNRSGSDVNSRSRLLNMVRMARDYCELNNIEFLVNRMESVTPETTQ
jgi:hypothetical protein